MSHWNIISREVKEGNAATDELLRFSQNQLCRKKQLLSKLDKVQSNTAVFLRKMKLSVFLLLRLQILQVSTKAEHSQEQCLGMVTSSTFKVLLVKKPIFLMAPPTTN